MKASRACVIAAALFAFLFTSGYGQAASSQTALNQANALIDKRDYKGAIVLLDKIIIGDPQNAKALVMRGDAKDEAGDNQGALVDYNAAIEINPNYEYAYATRCGTQNELGHYSDAIDDCTKALSLQANDDSAFRGRSAAYFFLDDYSLAASDADHAIAIDGSNPWNILARCRAQVWLTNLNDGMKACNTFISLKPESPFGYFYRAHAEVMMQKWDAAKADYHKTLQLDDTWTGAHYWLAVVTLNQKRYNEAIAEADAYLANNAGNADTLLVRAQAEAGSGDKKTALTDARLSLHEYQIENDTDGMKRAQSFIDGLGK